MRIIKVLIKKTIVFCFHLVKKSPWLFAKARRIYDYLPQSIQLRLKFILMGRFQRAYVLMPISMRAKETFDLLYKE